MALNDPLFSPESPSPARPWWLHPAVLVLALLLLAGGLAWATSKPPRERPPRQIEIEFDVIYDEEDMAEDMSADMVRKRRHDEACWVYDGHRDEAFWVVYGSRLACHLIGTSLR